MTYLLKRYISHRIRSFVLSNFKVFTQEQIETPYGLLNPDCIFWDSQRRISNTAVREEVHSRKHY